MTTNQTLWLDQGGLRVGANQLTTSGSGVGVGTSSIYGALTVAGTSAQNAAIFLGNVGIGTTSATVLFGVFGAGGSNPNFIMQGDGEQTFRFYNTATTGSTRVSWKIANRLNSDWSWIMYTDTPSNGTNDFVLQNSSSAALYADASGNVAIKTSSTTAGYALSVNGYITDTIGNLRDIVNNGQGGAYILVAADNGKLINITTGGVTVNINIFSAGNNITIFNNSAVSQTITQGTSVTMYLAGTATTGNRTLAQRGTATIICVAANTFVISGSGLT